MIVAICDDDLFFRSKLKKYLLEYKCSRRIQMDILEFSNGNDLINTDTQYDIVFLDYQMPNINGMEVARIIRSKNSICSIIFVTSFPEFMVQAFEVNTYRFLIKPIDIDKLTSAIDCYIIDKKRFSPLIINNDDGQIVVNSQDIIYIEGDGKYSNIHRYKDTVHSSKTLSAIYKLLPQYCFYRVHKSYIINLYCIKEIKSNCIILINGEKASINKNNMGKFKKEYKHFIKYFITR